MKDNCFHNGLLLQHKVNTVKENKTIKKKVFRKRKTERKTFSNKKGGDKNNKQTVNQMLCYLLQYHYYFPPLFATHFSPPLSMTPLHDDVLFICDTFSC